MEKCLWSLLHRPDGSDCPIFWASKDIIRNSRWQQRVGDVSMSGCFLCEAILKMKRCLLLFYHHLAKSTDATIGRISLSGYCSVNVRVNFGRILFSYWSPVFWAYLNPNLTNFQQQSTGMKRRAILPLISKDFSILLICVHPLCFFMKNHQCFSKGQVV